MRTAIFIALMSLFVSTSAISQGLCGNVAGAVKGGFTVDKTFSCVVPTTINVTNTSGVANVQYVFYYNDQAASALPSLSPTTSTSNAYLFDGTFTILQYGTKGGKPMYACQQVEIAANPEPEFTYNACNGNTIELQIPKTARNFQETFDIDFSYGATIRINQADLPYKIQKTGLPFALTRTIKVTGTPSASSGCPAKTKTISADMSGFTTKSYIKSVDIAADGKDTKIELVGAKGVDYEFFMRESTQAFPALGSGDKKQAGITTVTLPDASKSYCFRFFRNFGCFDISNEICTLPPKIDIDGKQNTLTVPSFPTTLKHDLFNNPSQIITNTLENQTMKVWRIEPSGSLTPVTVIGNTQINDSPIDCKKETCYKIEIEIKQKGANTDRFKTILTQKVCIDRSKIKAPAIKVGSVSVDAGNNVDIKFEDITYWKLKRDTFFVYRSPDKNIFKKVHEQLTPSAYKDISIDASKQQYCYRIGYVDECGSTSADSLTFCAIYLSTPSETLKWTPETPYEGLVSGYEIEKFDENTAAITSEGIFPNTTTTHTPDISTYDFKAAYRVKVPISGGGFSYSNVAIIPIVPVVYLPTAFTPNNSAPNDIFTLTGRTKRFTSFRMQIYNRWGNIVFETTDITKGWDGKLLGTDNNAEEGQYNYVIDAVLDTGEKMRWSGLVMLMR